MLRALGEYTVVGVRTTIPALERIVGHPDFRAGRLSTALLDRILPGMHPHEGHHAWVALIAAVLAEYERTRRPVSDAGSRTLIDTGPSAWSRAARPGGYRA